MTTGRKQDIAVATICGAIALGAVLFAALASCGYGAAACKIIDTAHDACTVLRYMEADGTVREVHVTREELAELGRAAARREAEKAYLPDGGR